MSSRDDRFREGKYPLDPDPAPALQRHVETFPGGRAMDIPAGTGRNTVFLAERGYEVDAIDRSREGLEIAGENTAARGVEDRCRWIRAGALERTYSASTYDVITARSFRIMDRLTDAKASLSPGGVLYYQDHMESESRSITGRRTDGASGRTNCCVPVST